MHRKIIYPIGIVLILGLVYAYTLAPGLSWANGGADGGDFITAIAINGVPHPTGYPLYLLIGKIFQWLPLGNLAFRTNLLSAICTVLAAVIVYQTIFYLQKEKEFGQEAATISALMFGLSPLVWSQAVITEVYGLQSLLTIVIFYQVVHSGEKPYENFQRGLLFGLALGNHLTTILLFPLLFFSYERLKISSFSQLLCRFFGILIGLSAYIILPFRAANNPPVNWFDPTTFNSLFKLISGSIYQSYFSVEFFFDRARAWAGFLIHNLSIPGISIGIFTLLDGKENKKAIFFTVWIFLVYGVFALIYTSYDSFVYLIPTILVFTLWIGLSMDRIISYMINRWEKSGWFIFTALIVFLFLRIYFVLPKVNASNDNRAELFGQTVFDTVPDNAIIFTKDDQSTFALWYFRFGEKQRIDTSIIAEGLLPFDWYRRTLHTTYTDLNIPELSNLSAYPLILSNPTRPYCFVNYQERTIINCYHF